MAPSNSIPPPLAPSVEEAYRRKCIQLKARTREVEDANDGGRVRLGRLKRQVEKLRLERAFLLEQLARRTSTNVEESDGSPSPPPTARPLFLESRPLGATTADASSPAQPDEKPLRTKRGHRKASLLANLETPAPAGATFISQNLQTLSPSSDAFSHGPGGEGQARKPARSRDGRANGTSTAGRSAPKKPSTAFELYCADARPALEGRAKDDDEVGGEGGGGGGIDEELARAWKDLTQEKKDEYESQHDTALAEYKKAKEDETAAANRDADGPGGESPAARDEDVEMGNYDTDAEVEAEAEAEAEAEVGDKQDED